jgi:chromate transporter
MARIEAGPVPSPAGPVRDVFLAFLRLGLTSFGGPIAHIGYLRTEFVERRGWISDRLFAQLLALSQFLPGPASSQLGFAIGLLRGGVRGALAAFAAFTLPSALLLFAFAAVLPAFSSVTGRAALHGLELVALPVVAHGLLGMAPRLCPDAPRIAIAAAAAALILLRGQVWTQLLVIALGAAAGAALLRRVEAADGGALPLGYGPRTGAALLGLFAALLAGLPLLAGILGGPVAVAEAFYRSGALVFGGGHVVLPLLAEAVVTPGWIPRDAFLAGYGAAQAVPGPMFSFAAYLGAQLAHGAGGVAGALLAVAAIFLPGLLLIAGALPLWGALAARPGAARAVAGVNAAVVGVLAAALYDPLWTAAVRGPADVAIALAGLALRLAWRGSALAVVAWCVGAKVALALAGPS